MDSRLEIAQGRKGKERYRKHTLAGHDIGPCQLNTMTILCDNICSPTVQTKDWRGS